MIDIDGYIRMNRERYTREALDAKLREAGHDDASIDAAWARAATADGDVEAAPRGPLAILGRLLLIGCVAVAYGYVAFFGLLGVTFSLSYNQSATGLVAALQAVILVAYGLAMLVSFLFVTWRIWKAGTLGRRGSTIAGSVGVAFVLLVGVSGACFAVTIASSALKSALR